MDGKVFKGCVTLLMQVPTNSVNAFLTLSFLLFEHGDHALAVLVRTTIDFSQTRAEKRGILRSGKFSIRAKPLEVIEHKIKSETDEDTMKLDHSSA
ncbi:hypothetical protein UCDDA912_g10254 [Diaporthe ampelina]|uniref:Uncharacterized protein n=1 Tax=Diaporthe ampelina TaxID=1214573 RepID=A0A0G2F6G5_9PEZI|nr:hypothetical protein UCDDA912_g10254 [Diaporthe ampelina]